MANSDKDILITPNKGTASLPELSFVGQVNSPIKLRVLDDNTLSFEGSAGQLFSINNNLTTGTIFAVSDVSGVPSLSVDANGAVAIAPFNGNVTVAAGSFTTDRQLAVRGSIIIANRGTIPAKLEFTEIANSGANITNPAPAQIYYDGPNYGDNNNYLAISTAGSDRLTVTYGGGVGINTNNPRTRLQIVGAHGDTSWRLTLPAASNGGGTGDIHMQAWVSEPGLTWDCGGIGMNVTNYTIATFPTGISDASNNHMPRLNTNIGQAYIRFFPQQSHRTGAAITFSTTDNDNTQYRDQIEIRRGCLGINGINTTYKLNVGGDINFTGNLYKSGAIFETLPTQSASTRGAFLKSNGTAAYWDSETSDSFTGSVCVRGYTLGGYQNATAWLNVNRTDHASDTTYNLGDQVSTLDAYTAACSNGTYAYVLHPGGNWTANGRDINRFNMLTDTNADIATQMLTTKDRNSVMRSKFVYAYSFGDNQPEKFNILTETPSLFLSSSDQNGSNAGNPACGNGELRGWHMVSGTRGNYLEFATETWNSWAAPGPDGTNKTFSTYTGFMYWNTGGGYSTGNAWSKRHDYDGSQYLTVGKPGATGEESLHTGELKGYMVGMYNGAQNNQGGIMNYTNNSFTFVSSVNSVGPGGRASAAGIEYGRGV